MEAAATLGDVAFTFSKTAYNVVGREGAKMKGCWRVTARVRF